MRSINLLLLALLGALLVVITHHSADGIRVSKARLNKAWTSFTKSYGKVYNSLQELDQRKTIFNKNYQFIVDHNARSDSEYTLGVNGFSDLTNDEFKSKYLSLKVPKEIEILEMFTASRTILENGLEDSKASNETCGGNMSNKTCGGHVDWRKIEPSVINEVKNQGSCGSCWSYATQATLETAYAINYNELPRFSEQYLLDCDKTNHACNGGWPTTAFDHVKEYGTPLESEFPYLGYLNTENNCTAEGYNRSEKFDYEYLTRQSDHQMMKLVKNKGMLLVAIDSTESLQFYKSGIFSDNKCKRVNHAINMVGYHYHGKNATESESEQSYWIMRNSWGTQWGEDGYFRLKMDPKACLIKNHVWYAEYNGSSSNNGTTVDEVDS